MIDSSPECVQLIGELRPLVLRLTLVSHAPSQSFNPAPPPEDLKVPPRWRIKGTVHPTPHMGSHSNFGGDTMIPRGSIDRKGDLTPEYRQKSDAYFSMTLGRWERSHHVYGVQDLRGLIKEAKDALYDWQHTPSVRGVEHERDTFLWKCEIADSDLGAEDVCHRYGISRRTLRRYRERYRGVKRAA